MTFTEKIEILHVCDQNNLDVSFAKNGLIQIYSWNDTTKKINWSIMHLPSYPVDELFKELYHRTNTKKR